MATQDRVADLYKNIRYSLSHSALYNEWRMQKLDSLVRWSERESWMVLDNGCGIGLLAEWLNSHHRSRIEVHGVDLSLEMLKHARMIIDGRICQADSQRLPYKDEVFDIVFSNSLLHHLPSAEAGLREIHRILKEGGLLCLVDPNRALLPSLVRRVFQKKDHFSEVHQDFDLKKFRIQVSTHFEIESSTYFGYVAYPLLGFPDVLKVLRFKHFPQWLAKLLISIDEVLARIPWLRAQGFGFMMKTRKRR